MKNINDAEEGGRGDCDMQKCGLKTQSDHEREHRIYRVTIMGSVWNLLLLIFKFVAGIVGQSAAMVADAVHSLSDFFTDVIVLLFVRISGKPQDKCHEYGHGKFETLATAIIGLVLLGVGAGILWSGGNKIFDYYANGVELEAPGIVALVAAVASVVVKEALYRYSIIVGRKVNSPAVVANAWHHRSDALSSIGTMAGIGGAILLGKDWRVLDPIAAVVVSFFIMKVAYELAVPCFEELMEKSLPEETEATIVKTLLSFPGVSQPHNLRTRRIGSRCAIEVHVRMDGNMTVNQSHDTTRKIEKRLRELLGEGAFVNIHVEPTK